MTKILRITGLLYVSNGNAAQTTLLLTEISKRINIYTDQQDVYIY